MGIKSSKLTTADLNGLDRAGFEWADSYDHKDWDRLSRNISPVLNVDYTGIGRDKWPEMPAADFIAMISDPSFLGNQRIATQHLIGAGFYSLIGPDFVEGKHQIRAAHQVYTDDTHEEVKLTANVHGTNTHWYRKVNGVWKFAGLKPVVIWTEGPFDKVFLPDNEAS